MLCLVRYVFYRTRWLRCWGNSHSPRHLLQQMSKALWTFSRSQNNSWYEKFFAIELNLSDARSCTLSRRTRIGPRHWSWVIFAQVMLKTVLVNVMVLYRWKEHCSRARPAAPLRSLWRHFWRLCHQRRLCRRSPFLSVQLESAWLTLSLWPVCWHDHLQDILEWAIIGISRYFMAMGQTLVLVIL